MKDGSEFFLNEALMNLKGFNCEIRREYSLDAVKTFPDNSIDFVFIDGNHALDHVVCDLTQWTKKVKVGGIISGHDYKDWPPDAHIHVKEGVQAFTKVYQISPWFITNASEGMFFWVKT
jgi:predicted O-methyltransferase YrrM